MTNFERLFIEVLEERREKDRIAEENGIKKVIKEMIKKKVSDEFIIDTTKIDKKELQKLKKEMKTC